MKSVWNDNLQYLSSVLQDYNFKCDTGVQDLGVKPRYPKVQTLPDAMFNEMYFVTEMLSRLHPTKVVVAFVSDLCRKLEFRNWTILVLLGLR
jgi:hypothetical protein